MSPEQVEGQSRPALRRVFPGYPLLRAAHRGAAVSGRVSRGGRLIKPEGNTETRYGALPALPHDIARIVRRCLVKDRTRRFQSAVEVVNETRELQEEVASGQRRRCQLPTNKGRVTPRVVAAALVAGLVCIGFVSAKSINTTPNVSRFRKPCSNHVGRRRGRIADVVSGRRKTGVPLSSKTDCGIWVAPAAGGRPLNLTNDYEGRDYAPAWSPNRDRIAFQSDRDGGGFFVISAFGGPARRVCPGSGNDARNQFNASASVPYGAPVWSSDGSEIAVWTAPCRSNSIPSRHGRRDRSLFFCLQRLRIRSRSLAGWWPPCVCRCVSRA